MSLWDLLRMSTNSLKRRKLRTFLTVLGVIIGTASIVVMISLGLGMQQSMYRQVEESGGMTSITVTAKDAGANQADNGERKKAKKAVTDDTIRELEKLAHVKSANPTYQIQVSILTGRYIGNVELTGMTPQTLKQRNIKLKEGGRLPAPEGKELELVFGNAVLHSFVTKNGGSGFYDTGVVPEIDFMSDQMFLVLDQESYNKSREKPESSNDAGASSAGKTEPVKTAVIIPKKYVVKASGLVEGDINSYNMNSYSVYCDLDILKAMLKKEFNGRAIPGQPTTKSGKPQKEFTYTSAIVQADDMEHVEALTTAIREMGYQVSTNAEYMESMKSQFAMVQAVLGGIGAVSLLVAAIGIANTMMMSIYERTKEIGVMKVLGCSLGNIRQLFLIEAAFIGFLGGIIGNALSFLMSFLINLLTRNSGALGMDGAISYIPVWLVMASLVFAVLVGMLAGYFPAVRAMRLSPLAAIQNS